MEDERSFSVNFADGTSYDMAEIRRREQAFMPDGEHAWVLYAIYAIDDPEKSMDDMELGAENFVGVSQIHCLLCHEDYATAKRHHKCPQRLAERTPG